MATLEHNVLSLDLTIQAGCTVRTAHFFRFVTAQISSILVSEWKRTVLFIHSCSLMPHRSQFLDLHLHLLLTQRQLSIWQPSQSYYFRFAWSFQLCSILSSYLPFVGSSLCVNFVKLQSAVVLHLIWQMIYPCESLSNGSLQLGFK